MPATVSPRKTSSERRRSRGGFGGVGLETGTGAGGACGGVYVDLVTVGSTVVVIVALLYGIPIIRPGAASVYVVVRT
jgi:hypothetical protein